MHARTHARTTDQTYPSLIDFPSVPKVDEEMGAGVGAFLVCRSKPLLHRALSSGFQVERANTGVGVELLF